MTDRIGKGYDELIKTCDGHGLFLFCHDPESGDYVVLSNIPEGSRVVLMESQIRQIKEKHGISNDTSEDWKTKS